MPKEKEKKNYVRFFFFSTAQHRMLAREVAITAAPKQITTIGNVNTRLDSCWMLRNNSIQLFVSATTIVPNFVPNFVPDKVEEEDAAEDAATIGVVRRTMETKPR